MKLYYKDGYKYQSTRNYEFVMDLGVPSFAIDFISYDSTTGVIHVDKWYCWDGASSIAIDTDTNIRGSLCHDVLYQLIRLEIIPQSFRKRADEKMMQICKEDGMGWFRRWYYFKALRKFAAFAANPKNVKKEKVCGS